MSRTRTHAAGGRPPWQPPPEAFRQLHRGNRVADRGGRVWTVHAASRHVNGQEPIVLRSDDHVRRVWEGWADDYRLVAEDDVQLPRSTSDEIQPLRDASQSSTLAR